MNLPIERKVTRKKFELILKYVNGLKTRAQTGSWEKVSTVDFDEIAILFKQNYIPISATPVDPDIIMILFHLATNYPTAKAPLLTICIGTKDKDICFIRN